MTQATSRQTFALPRFNVAACMAVWLWAGLTLALPTQQALAITGASLVAQQDATYDAVAAVTLNEWRDLNVPIGNAVLIAPDRVVMPRHLVNSTFLNPTSQDGAASQYVLRFRVNPDGSRGRLSSPSSFFHVGVVRWIVPKARNSASDIVVGVLETPVTHITPMQVESHPRLIRGRLAASLLSWGPTETGEKGELRIGGIRVGQIGTSVFSWQVGSQGLVNDSGAAAVVMKDGTARLVGFVTTARSGIVLRKWRSSTLMR